MKSTTVLLCLMVSGSAVAAPLISSVSGTPQDGGTITISGSGFSAKAQAAPHKWDDFESGTPGASITGWYLNGAPQEPKYSIERSRAAGRQSAYQDFTNSNYASTLALTDQSPGFRTIYISGWFYREVGGAPSRNVKTWGLRGGSGFSELQPNARMDQYPNSSSGQIMTYENANGACDADTGSYTAIQADWSLSGDLFPDAWNRFEAWLDTDSGGSNGEYTVWVNGDQLASVNGQIYTHDCPFPMVMLQNYFATDTGSPTPWMKHFWDELYIDRVRARVEIGDASTWATTTHREIQLPTAWSTSSVTATVNQGTFAAGATAYLYVVDSDGVVNSAGYPVTFGGSGDTDPPDLSSLGPSGAYAKSTSSLNLAVETDEASTCRYSHGVATTWANMTEFGTTGGTSHSQAVATWPGLVRQSCYRCQDTSLNESAASCTTYWVEPELKQPVRH